MVIYFGGKRRRKKTNTFFHFIWSAIDWIRIYLDEKGLWSLFWGMRSSKRISWPNFLRLGFQADHLEIKDLVSPTSWTKTSDKKYNPIVCKHCVQQQEQAISKRWKALSFLSGSNQCIKANSTADGALYRIYNRHGDIIRNQSTVCHSATVSCGSTCSLSIVFFCSDYYFDLKAEEKGWSCPIWYIEIHPS